MRLYHFLNAEYGLEGIGKRRLKISRIHDLNDPFEFYSLELSNKFLRRAIEKTKREVSERPGVLCFSKSWSNPVLWSNYSDRHRGLVLGFEIPDEVTFPVR